MRKTLPQLFLPASTSIAPKTRRIGAGSQLGRTEGRAAFGLIRHRFCTCARAIASLGGAGQCKTGRSVEHKREQEFKFKKNGYFLMFPKKKSV